MNGPMKGYAFGNHILQQRIKHKNNYLIFTQLAVV